MVTIYKYRLLSSVGKQVQGMPTGAEILSVQDQRGELCIWAKVNTENPNEKRYIELYETGDDIPNPKGLNYIGTVLRFGDSYVIHVFERTNG